MADNDKAIDLADVLERVQDDWELLLELLDIFDQDFSAKRSVLAQMVMENNFDKVRDIAHSLKGASGNISAKPLFHSFYQLEKMGESRDLTRAGEVLKSIDAQIVELKASVVQLKKDYKNR